MQDSQATLELGCWLGILTRDLEVSEYGLALNTLCSRAASGTPGAATSAEVAALLLWLCLRSDILLAALLKNWDRLPPQGTVEALLELVLEDVRRAADPDDLLPAPELSDLRQHFQARPRVARRALEARFALLVELGLARPRADGAPALPAGDRLRSLTASLRETPLTREDTRRFLDRRYFSAWSHDLPGRRTRPAPEEAQILLWLCRAYQALQRPLGFTPGRPLAVLACGLARRAGIVLEIEDAFACVYGAADGRWSDALHFSGGSRFDREFLIRIDPELASELERSLDRRP